MIRKVIAGAAALSLLSPMVLPPAKAKHGFFPLVVTLGQRKPSTGGTTDYTNPGGQGDRTATITVTSNILGFNNGTASNLVDGGLNNNSTDSCDFVHGRWGAWVKFDFGAGNYEIIDEIKWFSSTTATQGSWTVWGSVDGNFWAPLKTTFTLGGSTINIITFSNTNGYRYYLFLQDPNSTNGTDSNPWQQEVQFKILAGSAATVDSTERSYANKGGFGDRSSTITISTTATMASGVIGKLIDGNTFTLTTGNAWFTGGQSGREIKFDFGAGYSPVITEFTWVQDTTANHGTWKFAGSGDDSTYTDLLTGFLLGSAKQDVHAVTNSTGYRFYKLIQTAGTTSSNPDLQQIFFKIGT